MNASIESQKTIIQIALETAAEFIAPINPFLYWTDSYKLSHILFETEGVSEIYSNLTPRFDHYLRAMLGKHYDGKVVVFGIQWMLFRLHATAKKGFFDRPKDEVIAEMKATHGYLPDKPDYKTFFLATGYGIREKVEIESMELYDEGPTLARLMGLDLGKVDGRVVEEILY